MGRNRAAATLRACAGGAVVLALVVLGGAPAAASPARPSGQDEPTVRCDELVDGQANVTQFALQPDESETDVLLRTADSKSFSLVYTSSCILDRSELDIDVAIEPGVRDDRDLPARVESQVQLRARRDGITVTLPIVRSELSAGSYDGVVVLSGDEVATVRTPIALTIKDQRWYLPILATTVGLVAGVAVAAFAALSNRGDPFDPLRDTWRMLRSPWGIVALLAAAGVGFFVPDGPFQTGFIDDDRWLWTAGSATSLAVRAFATGTGTAVATLFVRGAARHAGAAQPASSSADPPASVDRAPRSEPWLSVDREEPAAPEEPVDREEPAEPSGSDQDAGSAEVVESGEPGGAR